jgi:hypothetical protein
VLKKDKAKEEIAQITASIQAAKADQDRKRAQAVAAGQPFDEQPIGDDGIPTIEAEREVEVPKIKWYKCTVDHILEENEWPGKMIPVAFAVGEYTNIGGKKYWNGMFRHGKDAQRMLNNAYTTMWECIMLMPKTPIQASAKMIEGYETDYLDSNKSNFPVLKYKYDEKFPGMKPERMQPATPPTAIIGLFESCKQDIKDMLGIHDADLGDQGRELSGKAILERQRPSGTATFVWHDIKTGWVAHVGKILNDVIGHYYAGERTIRVRTENKGGYFTPINTTAGKAHQMIKQDPAKFDGMDKKSLQRTLRKGGAAAPYHDITDGEYDVIVSTGPAYATQRQEAAENLIRIAQFSNKMNPVMLYYLVSSLDSPSFKELAATLKKMLPQGLLPAEEGEQQTPPMPPTPQAQVQMAKIQLDMEKTKVAKIQAQVKMVELQKALAETKSEVAETVTNRLEEIFSPHHPADVPEGMGPQGGMQP